MNLKTSHLLAISSFAVHGTASLKTFTSILGDKILPVPSIMLNGLTNMSLVKKFEVPFRELLHSSLELARARQLDLILYVGYLGNADQADTIVDLLAQYRSIIRTVVVDPVCGDHGRKYVSDEIIARWPRLIEQADYVFPNLTELKLLTGKLPDADTALLNDMQLFQQLFPRPRLVITSVPMGEDMIGVLVPGDAHYSYFSPALAKNYGGTGDAFLAEFVLNYFYKELPFTDALKIAADLTWERMKYSIAQGSDDLLLAIHKHSPLS